MNTTAQHADVDAPPTWAVDIQRFPFGEVAYGLTAAGEPIATAINHGESGHPVEISVDVWDIVEDDGTVQRTDPQVLLFDTVTHDVSFTFSVEQARVLRDALAELLVAVDRGAA